MLYDGVLFLHFVATLFFAGFILLDRVLFREYFKKTESSGNDFYKMGRKIVIAAAGMLLLSGAALTLIDPALWKTPLFIVKVVLALAVTGLFFYCPAFSKHAGSRTRLLYRSSVTLLLLTVLVLGKLFI